MLLTEQMTESKNSEEDVVVSFGEQPDIPKKEVEDVDGEPADHVDGGHADEQPAGAEQNSDSREAIKKVHIFGLCPKKGGRE